MPHPLNQDQGFEDQDQNFGNDTFKNDPAMHNTSLAYQNFLKAETGENEPQQQKTAQQEFVEKVANNQPSQQSKDFVKKIAQERRTSFVNDDSDEMLALDDLRQEKLKALDERSEVSEQIISKPPLSASLRGGAEGGGAALESDRGVAAQKGGQSTKLAKITENKEVESGEMKKELDQGTPRFTKDNNKNNTPAAEVDKA